MHFTSKIIHYDSLFIIISVLFALLLFYIALLFQRAVGKLDPMPARCAKVSLKETTIAAYCHVAKHHSMACEKIRWHLVHVSAIPVGARPSEDVILLVHCPAARICTIARRLE